MDLYEEIVKLRQDGRRGAVATIVNVRGSIPSFKTAKMLVRDDGRGHTGTDERAAAFSQWPTGIAWPQYRPRQWRRTFPQP